MYSTSLSQYGHFLCNIPYVVGEDLKKVIVDAMCMRFPEHKDLYNYMIGSKLDIDFEELSAESFGHMKFDFVFTENERADQIVDRFNSVLVVSTNNIQIKNPFTDYVAYLAEIVEPVEVEKDISFKTFEKGDHLILFRPKIIDLVYETLARMLKQLWKDEKVREISK